MIESENKLLTTSELLGTTGFTTKEVTTSKVYKQSLTHRLIHGKFFHLEVDQIENEKDWLKIPIEELKIYSFPKIIRDYLNERFNYLY